MRDEREGRSLSPTFGVNSASGQPIVGSAKTDQALVYQITGFATTIAGLARTDQGFVATIRAFVSPLISFFKRIEVLLKRYL
jgi:hypothetical protein